MVATAFVRVIIIILKHRSSLPSKLISISHLFRNCSASKTYCSETFNIPYCWHWYLFYISGITNNPTQVR